MPNPFINESKDEASSLTKQKNHFTSSRNMAVTPEGKSRYEADLDEAIKEHVDSLIAEIKDKEGNKLLSPEALRDKLEHEIRAAADFSEFGKQMTSAFTILRGQGVRYLEKSECDALIKSLDKLSQQLADLDLKQLSNENLKAALAIPVECKNSVLKIGIAKFNEGLFDDSLAIFTFLTTVDDEQPDYWYRLGLVALEGGHDELALHAFANTSSLALDFIGAHIFAAQCYVKKGMRNEAFAELEEAKRIQKSTNRVEEWQKYIDDVQNLLAA